jgi:hypothetical protein
MHEEGHRVGGGAYYVWERGCGRVPKKFEIFFFC